MFLTVETVVQCGFDITTIKKYDLCLNERYTKLH